MEGSRFKIAEVVATSRSKKNANRHDAFGERQCMVGGQEDE